MFQWNFNLYKSFELKGELDSLNQATTDINSLETELSEERTKFRNLRNEAAQQLAELSTKYGNAVERARPYYDASKEAKQVSNLNKICDNEIKVHVNLAGSRRRPARKACNPLVFALQCRPMNRWWNAFPILTYNTRLQKNICTVLQTVKMFRFAVRFIHCACLSTPMLESFT